MRVKKPSSVAFVFQALLIIQGKTKARHFCDFCSEALHHAHAPGQHMWPSLGPWSDSKCSQTVEVGCSYSELKPCQCEIAAEEIQEEKNYREHNIKSARVSALNVLVPRHKVAEGWQKVSATSRNRTRTA